MLLLLVTFLTPCGACQVHATSVTLVKILTFCVDCARVYSCCSDPDQSGRIVLQGLVAAARILRLGERWSPWGGAGALVDFGKVNVLSCPIL